MAEMPHIRVEVMTVLRAFQPGDLVFIECERRLSREQMTELRSQIERVAPEIRVVVLDGGLRVVGREERHDITTTSDTMPPLESPSSSEHAGQGQKAE